MAQAFVHMLEQAYNALLSYGVNYKSLPEYKDQTLLDEAQRLPLLRGQERYLAWIERVRSGIRAAINRKSFKRVE